MRSIIAVAICIAGTTGAFAIDRSCLATAGRAQAARIVRDCKAISEATHPPCNAANPCDMIIEEVERWCEINRKSRLNYKSFCKDYPDVLIHPNG